MSKMKIWFQEDVSRWENLSPLVKKALAKYNPYPPAPTSPRAKRKTRVSNHEDILPAILKLADGTRSIIEIANNVKLTRTEVTLAVAVLRRRGESPVFKLGLSSPREKLLPTLLKLANGTKTIAEVSRKMKLTRKEVVLAATILKRRGAVPRFKPARRGRPPVCELTDFQKRVIALVKSGESQRSVAIKFEVTPQYISLIMKRAKRPR